MPRAKGGSAQGDSEAEQATVAAFLRGLAQQAEADATFAARLHAVARECGLLDMAPGGEKSPTRRTRAAKAPTVRERAAGPAPDPLNPFAVLREREEVGLRAALAPLGLSELRAIIRAHRLDSARVSARWTARERLVELIVDQVRARANHGRAFERV
jgi:hypothetical protein